MGPESYTHQYKPEAYEGLEGNEVMPFPNADEAADWFQDTIPELARVEPDSFRNGTPNGIDAWPKGVSAELSDTMTASGIEVEYSQSDDKLKAVSYSIAFADDIGGKYRIDGHRYYDYKDKMKPVDSTSISYVTDHDGVLLETDVTRNGRLKVRRDFEKDTLDAERSEYSRPVDYIVPRPGSKPEEGGSRFMHAPDQLAAEQTFLELAAQAREALQSKMATIDPAKMAEIEQRLEAQDKARLGRVAAFAGKIKGLFS